MHHVPSPSQTIGPFPHESWRWAFMRRSALEAAPIVIAGRVVDGNGDAVTDAVIEARSAVATGWVDGLPGFQRVACDGDGRFMLAVPERPGLGAPALLLTVFARGLLCHQFTAVWLADDPGMPDATMLASVPPGRRATLLARRGGDDDDAGQLRYVWDLHLQGAQETVFFDYR